MSTPETQFLGYTPVELAFGTSGLRGLVKDITDLEAYINVKGTLAYLLQGGDLGSGSTVVVAGDLRPSTPRILRAVARAVVDLGLGVENAGLVPTPALVLHAIAQRRAGVMVTGSHIPFDRNGIKVNTSRGELLKRDEAPILAEVARIRAVEYARSAGESRFGADGMLKSGAALDLPARDPGAERRYVERYLRVFPGNALAGQRILFYQHSAVGRDLLPEILRALGAEVITAGRSETFIPIDTENVTDEQLDRLTTLVEEAERERGAPFAVVSTDGDSDRPLVTHVLARPAGGASARRVRFLPGDLLGLVVAEALEVEAAAVPISANDAVATVLRARGATLIQTRIGSPYVIAAMDELNDTQPGRRVVGWEANGGFLVGSELDLDGRPLGPLPTRDAMLPIVTNLWAAARTGVDLGTLWSRLPTRFGRAGLIDELPVAQSRALLAALVPAGTPATDVEFVGDAVLDRGGAAPRPLADPAAAAWRERRQRLEHAFPAALGFDRVRWVNLLDGVRVGFANGDVAHLRPSGNAPQLRLYALADSEARADAIVRLGLAEPDGILRQLARTYGG
jgi:phosphomannomutase